MTKDEEHEAIGAMLHRGKVEAATKTAPASEELVERLCRACREGYIEREAEEVLRLNTVMQPCDQLPRLRDELAAERQTVATLRAELAAAKQLDVNRKLREALVKAKAALTASYMERFKKQDIALAAIDAALAETGGANE